MAKSTASKLIDKHVKYCRDWLSRNGDFAKSRGEARIAKFLSQGDFAAAILLPSALKTLSLFYGMQGTLALHDGNDNGWIVVDRSVTYSYWYVMLAAEVTFKRLQQGERADSVAPLYHELPVAASLFCFATVHEHREWRSDIWGMLTNATSTPGAVISDYWRDQGSYEAFVLRCFDRNSIDATARDLPDSLYQVELGPYGDVLDAWNDPEQLVPAMYGICDYHCRNLMQKSGRRDPWPPFTDPPFDLMPYEILAINAFRKQLGLESPTLDHPLLETPLGLHKYHRFTPYSDETIQRVRELYETIK